MPIKYTFVLALLVLYLGICEYAFAVSKSNSAILIEHLEGKSLLLAQSLVLLMIVEECKELVVLTLDLFFLLLPHIEGSVGHLLNKCLLCDLLLELLCTWHVALEEVEEDVGVEEGRVTLDLPGLT